MIAAHLRKGVSGFFCFQHMAQEIPFNTEFYEQQHGDLPHHATKGTWTMLPPPTFGRRPWQFVDMTLAQARKQALQQIGDRPVASGEEFILVP